MDFWQKLDRATAAKGKGKTSEEAGLPKTAISNYISKKQYPRIDAAYKIATAMGVSLDWLLDDKADWPPPNDSEVSVISRLDDESLMFEVAQRQRRSILRLIHAVERAEEEDWSTAISRLSNAELLEVIFPIRYTAEMIGRFRPEFVARIHHKSMPGSGRPLEDFNQKIIMNRVKKLYSDMQFLAVSQAIFDTVPGQAIEDIEGELLWTTPQSLLSSLEEKSTITTPTAVQIAAGNLAGHSPTESIKKGSHPKPTTPPPPTQKPVAGVHVAGATTAAPPTPPRRPGTTPPPASKKTRTPRRGDIFAGDALRQASLSPQNSPRRPGIPSPLAPKPDPNLSEIQRSGDALMESVKKPARSQPGTPPPPPKPAKTPPARRPAPSPKIRK